MSREVMFIYLKLIRLMAVDSRKMKRIIFVGAVLLTLLILTSCDTSKPTVGEPTVTIEKISPVYPGTVDLKVDVTATVPIYNPRKESVNIYFNSITLNGFGYATQG